MMNVHSERELADIAAHAPLAWMLTEAARLRDLGHGDLISYSRKVFIPLTHLCRDQCHYCTFATQPKQGVNPYLSRDEVLAIARAGATAGCKEALFTLGDQPELRYSAARKALAEMGYATTLDYLVAMCRAVFEETGLLPHANPGVMAIESILQLRDVSVSQGLMLESSADRLCERGGVHFGSPDKAPAVRLATIEAAGRARVPFTSGILIGIGETRTERLESLLALRALHERHGHLQEIIVQNFRAKEGTKRADADEPDLDDLLWTVALARLVFGPTMNIQVPPNLTPDDYPRAIAAGINDWGGISPVTIDHVNPEAPWPALDDLARRTAQAGKSLVERLASYPRYVQAVDAWHAPVIAKRVRMLTDASGLARTDAWSPGRAIVPPSAPLSVNAGAGSRRIDQLLTQAALGDRLDEASVATLFSARGGALRDVLAAADSLRRATVGDTVRYVVNRNINYTNVCTYRCTFCAFSKGRHSANLRGAPYDLARDEIQRRVVEAWTRGATEVCMQGGIHPDYTGTTYLDIVRAVKEAEPRMHVHAFSPLEVTQGARTLGLPISAYLEQLREAGLGSLPGTAAEILDDSMRDILCPGKLRTHEWLDVVRTTHQVGLRTTATIMFGHVESPIHWARHLLAIRDLQSETGGFTEFVPLPFIFHEAPIGLRGGARPGPTWRETLLMHAVARLALHPLIPNIQASWVKLGPTGLAACLAAGANDAGGTLMNESISRAAGTEHGQELPPAEIDALVRDAGRAPQQRTTLYGDAPVAQCERSYDAPALAPLEQTPLRARASAPIL
jgi:FO synthase